MPDAAPDPMADADGTASARRRFAAWLEQHPGANAHELETLCASAPDCADRFRRWWRQLAIIGELGTRAEPDVPAQPAARTRIGPYHLERELGRGAQAAVHLATDSRDGRQVALKVLPAHAAPSRARQQRFDREASVLARLDHPGLCAVHDHGEADGVLYLAMALAPGETLAARLAAIEQAGALDTGRAGEPAGWRHAVAVIESAARALHAAHEVGLLHRDVKPSNLMVTPDGEAVVLDFGLARDDDDDRDLTLSGDLLGTPAYMSPEQLTAHRIKLDRRTDVYSLGATLFEALTLRRPFAAPTMDQLFQEILTVDPPRVDRLESLPTALGAVVATCLEKNRERRYANAAALADDLARVRRGQPVLARDVGRLEHARRWVVRHPLAAAFLTSQGVALVVVLWLYLRSESALRRFDQVATGPQVQRAIEAQLPLHPAWPRHLAALRQWMTGHAEPLLAKRDALRATRDSLRDTARAADGPLSVDSQAFLAKAADDAIAELDAFQHRHVDGPLGVRARIAWAERVTALSVERHAAAWDAARRAVAADPRFEGFELRPQLGLAPLGTHPTTGLLECVHLPSAADPTALPERGADGRVQVDATTGIVFVLLPASGGAPPFFAAAHELTKAQWLRLSDDGDAGYYKPGQKFRTPEPVEVTATHPVESKTWSKCDAIARRYGLALPSGAQWEYAARAGCTDRQPTTGADLARFAVLAPEANAATGDENVPRRVGSRAANDWGLYDTLGNVFEWVRDAGAQPDERVIRGGGCAAPPAAVLSFGFEATEYHDVASREIGVRFVRPVY